MCLKTRLKMPIYCFYIAWILFIFSSFDGEQKELEEKMAAEIDAYHQVKILIKLLMIKRPQDRIFININMYLEEKHTDIFTVKSCEFFSYFGLKIILKKIQLR